MPLRSYYVGSCLPPEKNCLFCFHQPDPCPNLCKYLVKGKEIYSDMPARIKRANAQIVCALNKLSHSIIRNSLYVPVSLCVDLYFGLCVSSQVGVCVGVQCLPLGESTWENSFSNSLCMSELLVSVKKRGRKIVHSSGIRVSLLTSAT